MTQEEYRNKLENLLEQMNDIYDKHITIQACQLTVNYIEGETKNEKPMWQN